MVKLGSLVLEKGNTFISIYTRSYCFSYSQEIDRILMISAHI